MDDRRVRGSMVSPREHDRPSAAWLACKMVAYTLAFIAFILVLVPFGFDRLAGRLLPADFTHWLEPGSPRSVVGAVVFVLGLAGYLFCSLWLVVVGKGPFVEFDPPKVFVATGPYRWARNPVAALLIVTVLGEAVFFGSVGILVLVLLGIPLAYYQVTRIEEPRLEARFGEDYIAYCRRVPRWIPKPPRDDLPSKAEVRPNEL